MFSSATTWGISGPTFLWIYAGLTATAALLAGLRWRQALGPRTGDTEHAELDQTRLARLNGGPQLAVTTVAVKLHQDGVLRAGEKPGTLVAAGRLAPRRGRAGERRAPGRRAHPGHQDLGAAPRPERQ